MKIEGRVALVTGANRGLGKAFVEALYAAGAARVYAAARDPSSIAGGPSVPVALDVTVPGSVAAAAAACPDVDLLVNNAGIMLATPMLTEASEDALRREMEVNVFGVQRMIRAFAPALARNGGGAIVNVLSVVSWFTSPVNATYSTSKRAALAVTEAARMELKAQGTRVIGVHAGFIDTDMAHGFDGPKTPPAQVVQRTLDALRSDADTVLADQRAEQVRRATLLEPDLFAAGLQRIWDERQRTRG